MQAVTNLHILGENQQALLESLAVKDPLSAATAGRAHLGNAMFPTLERLYLQPADQGYSADWHSSTSMQYQLREELIRTCRSRSDAGIPINCLGLQWKAIAPMSDVQELRKHVGTLAWDSLQVATADHQDA